MYLDTNKVHSHTMCEYKFDAQLAASDAVTYLNCCCHATPLLLLSQWTEGGANGRNGACARDRVALEYKQEHGHATVHDQLTEGSSVREPAARHVFVILMIAQVLKCSTLKMILL